LRYVYTENITRKGRQMKSNWKLVEPQNFEAIESEIKANLDSTQTVEVSSNFYGELSIAIDGVVAYGAKSISPLTWRVPMHTILETAKA